MRKVLTVLFAVASLAVYSQISIPASSKKGIIITQDNQKIFYSNLTYSNGKVTYINTQNGTEEFLYDNSVKGIQEEGKGSIGIIPDESLGGIKGTETPKLTAKRDIKDYLLQQRDPLYMKGRTVNNIGTVLVIGGGACFVIGGLSNLSKANSDSLNNNGESKGSPVPLIIGLVGAGAGVVLKLVGHSQMKDAMNNYSTADVRKFKPDYYVLNDRNGVGLMMKF
ncbi:hypothetical protein [Chryseobacterium sp. G0186]|uniref:hypothetical protein n=1 Tax=Chryseobacterium sp. G0186 TaxID=2487064 RepID=UPI000F4F52C7|nr:hypothetical protein [Chryseobacterium sp. G0186]